MKKYLWIFLIFISVLPLWSLVNPGLPLTHDGPDHVARIANFYQSLLDGNIIPRWAGNLNWGYGHPILMFLYPLPSYIASLFHQFGFNFVDSTKLVFALGFIASIISMYLWSSRVWGKWPGLVAAAIYGYAPYRFVDLYVRGAIGEHLAFVFPPIILLGLWQLASVKTKSKYSGIMITLGMSGLILAHNAISLMFIPVIGLYLLYLYFFETHKDNKYILFSLGYLFLGFMISAFFWIPAYFEGKYTLRDIVTNNDYRGRFNSWISFIYSKWSYGTGNELSKELGFSGIAAIIGTIIFLISGKIDIKKRIFILTSLCLLILSLFLMTDQSLVIWQHVSLIQKFQFPWRFLSIGVFICSVFGAIFVSIINARKQIWLSLIFIGLTILPTINMWKPSAYLNKPESYFSGIYNSTTDTGESSPVWSIRFMEHRPPAPAEIIEGAGKITPLNRSSSDHKYQVSLSSRSRFLENTLYFPGWRVYIDQKELLLNDLIYQDPNYRGLMTFWIDKGEHIVEFKFGETKLRQLSDLISLLGIIIVSGLVVRVAISKK